jgi:hypothetical protein
MPAALEDQVTGHSPSRVEGSPHSTVIARCQAIGDLPKTVTKNAMKQVLFLVWSNRP